MRGGEKVLEELCNIYPDADIFTHVVDEEKISDAIKKHKIHKTFISRLPFAKKLYKYYLPLMPLALESLNFQEYDLVISSESGPAKGIITSPNSTHICYCHSPMRYLWDHYHMYRKNSGFLSKLFMPLIFHFMRIWDESSSHRVDHFIANSHFIAKRIKKFYKRDSVVIHPPVDIDAFSIAEEKTNDFYLLAGELVPYKRPDIAIEAFTKNGKKLNVIGDGPELNKLKKIAGPNINFLGKVNFNELKYQFKNCRALIFPGEEDFGIIPVEVLASGSPIIGLGKGGLLDTFGDYDVGSLYYEESAEALINEINNFEKKAPYRSSDLQDRAKDFSKQEFHKKITATINQLLSNNVG